MSYLFTFSNTNFTDFGANLLQELFTDKKSFNVTLVSSELKTVQAHSHVLSVASVFFKDFFLVVESDNPVIYLKHIPFFSVRENSEVPLFG